MALVTVIAMGIACAEEAKKDDKKACEAPPTELVKKDLKPGADHPIKFRTLIYVDYTGWFYDGCAPDHKGAKFDSSEGRKTPFGFMVGAGKVIKGWDEGLIGMKENGKRLLVIPPDKAYGAAGFPPRIPPNSTLVFEIDYIKYMGDPAPQPGQ